MRNRKKSGGDGGGGANWMDTYGDLVTLLLTFFVLLFASSSLDASKWQNIVEAFTGNPPGQAIESIDMDNPMSGGISSGDILQPSDAAQEEIEAESSDPAAEEAMREQMRQVEEQFNALYEQLRQYVDDQGLQDSLVLDKDGMQILLTISEGILFDSGSADIRNADAEELLTQISTMLAQYLDSLKGITIEGHTDNVPIQTTEFKDNLDLSSMRANNVARFMSEAGTTPSLPMSMFSSLGRGEWSPIASNDTAEGKAKNRRVSIIAIAKGSEDLPPAQSMQVETFSSLD